MSVSVLCDMFCLCVRYYAEARTLDTVSANMLKDDVRRKDREVRERKSEMALMESMYKVLHMTSRCHV
jgi:hypothetical protein